MSSRSSSLARFASPTRSTAARVRTRTPSPAAGAGAPARAGAQQAGDQQAASSGAVAALLRHFQGAFGAAALLVLPPAHKGSPPEQAYQIRPSSVGLQLLMAGTPLAGTALTDASQSSMAPACAAVCCAPGWLGACAAESMCQTNAR